MNPQHAQPLIDLIQLSIAGLFGGAALRSGSALAAPPNDDSVTVFENGHANYGWADYRDNHLKPEIAAMKNVKYGLTDIKPHVDGNNAWATFKYTIEADADSKHVEGAGLATAILEKRGSDWKIVHWHSSAPRRKPADAHSQSKQ